MDEKGKIIKFKLPQPVKVDHREYPISINPILIPRQKEWWWIKGWEMTSETKIELVISDDED